MFFVENLSLFMISDEHFFPLLSIRNNKNVGVGAISSALSAHAGNLNGNVSNESALFLRNMFDLLCLLLFVL